MNKIILVVDLNLNKKVVKTIVNSLKEFDGKYVNFPEIRKVVTKNVNVINSGIRRVLYSMEKLGVVKIGKALSGHITIYNNIQIEDYYFNYPEVFNTIEKFIEEDDELSVIKNGIDYIVHGNRIYFDPINNFEFIEKWTEPVIPSVRITIDDFMNFIKRRKAEDVIVDLMFTDIKKYIYNELIKYYEVKRNGKSGHRK